MGTGGHALRAHQRACARTCRACSAPAPGRSASACWPWPRLLLGEAFPVYISDVSPWRLRFARALGGDRRSTPATAARWPQLHEIDAAIDSTGKSSACARASSGALGKRGVLACVGHGEGLSLDRLPRPDRPRARGARQRVLPLRRDGRQPGAAAGQPRLLRADHHPPLSARARSPRPSSCSSAGETGKVDRRSRGAAT